jgi:hypothetical protein
MKKFVTDQLDLFAYPLPTFNLAGNQKVSSCVGLACSIFLYTFILGFATSRLVILFVSRDPVLFDYKIEG